MALLDHADGFSSPPRRASPLPPSRPPTPDSDDPATSSSRKRPAEDHSIYIENLGRALKLKKTETDSLNPLCRGTFLCFG